MEKTLKELSKYSDDYMIDVYNLFTFIKLAEEIINNDLKEKIVKSSEDYSYKSTSIFETRIHSKRIAKKDLMLLIN